MKKICKVDGCKNKHLAKGYCWKHYLQLRRHGKILKRTVYDPNEIIITDDIAEIVLYNRKCQEIDRTIIDTEDVERVENHMWYLTDKGYAATNINGKRVKIQHIIMGTKSLIDHKDRNKLNNRKSNYRFCTSAENSKNIGILRSNTSGYKGVCWHKQAKKWQARIEVNKIRHYLGLFKTRKEAAKAYNIACLKHHGEFACLNRLG